MKYKSKVDWWYITFVLLFSCCTLYVCYGFFYTKNVGEYTLLLLLFLLCEFIFLLPNLMLTYYVLEQDAIYVRSGYFYCKYIAYDDIVKIRDSKAILSACGLAYNRIEITYKYKDSIDIVMISPKDKKKVKSYLEERVKIQDVKGLQEFEKIKHESINQPMNGIIR